MDETKVGLYQSKFKSLAAIKGFVEALEPGFESKLPAKESNVLTSSAKEKVTQQFKTMNLVVVHFLPLSFEEEEHLDFVEDARADDWPSGLTCKVWKNLDNKFRPSDVLAEADLTKKLMGLTLAKGEDPRKLGKRITFIQSRFKVQVVDKENISAVVNAGGF